MINIVGNNNISSDVLMAVEQYLEVKFPKGYREFLLQYNGGLVDKSLFHFKNEPHSGSIVDRFFGVTSYEYRNLLNYIKTYQERIPGNFIPIAADPGGNLILISVKGPDRGKIYFWDHEMEADPAQGESPSYDNLTLIADSFDEFLNSLRDISPEA